MAYNVKNLKGKEGGATLEVSDRPSTPGGLYRHPEAKDAKGNPIEMITLSDPLWGDTQSQAAMRLGFEYVGPAPEGSIKTIVEQNANSRIYNTDTVVSDKARLDQLELESLRREKIERESKETAKAEASKPGLTSQEVASQVAEAEENRPKDALDESGNIAKESARRETEERLNVDLPAPELSKTNEKKEGK